MDLPNHWPTQHTRLIFSPFVPSVVESLLGIFALTKSLLSGSKFLGVKISFIRRNDQTLGTGIRRHVFQP